MKRSFFTVSLLTLCAVSTALATTYVRVEKDGTKTYSDRPMPGGQPIDLQPAQSYSAPSAPSYGGDTPREQRDLLLAETFRYESCTVTPANDTTFQNPEAVNIGVTTNPPLRQSDIVTLTLDGLAVGGPNAQAFTLTPASRGTHIVGVTVKSSMGVVLCNSTSSFHVFRPSLNAPARAR